MSGYGRSTRTSIGLPARWRGARPPPSCVRYRFSLSHPRCSGSPGSRIGHCGHLPASRPSRCSCFPWSPLSFCRRRLRPCSTFPSCGRSRARGSTWSPTLLSSSFRAWSSPCHCFQTGRRRHSSSSRLPASSTFPTASISQTCRVRALAGIALQIAWIMALIALGHLLMTLTMRRIQIQGG
jgi:hypothetical protein